MHDELTLRHWIKACPDVATALARLRREQGLTLQEVADYAGLSKGYVYNVENGLRSPGREVLIALGLAAFSLTVVETNWLLDLGGYAPLRDTRRR